MPDDELKDMARRVLDGNRYLVLGTVEPDGRPRLSPVYFVPAGYDRLYWVSSPDAQHSRNVRERPEVQIVVFDSSRAPGDGEAVYVSATAREVPEDELPGLLHEAFDPEGRGGRRSAPRSSAATATSGCTSPPRRRTTCTCAVAIPPTARASTGVFRPIPAEQGGLPPGRRATTRSCGMLRPWPASCRNSSR